MLDFVAPADATTHVAASLDTIAQAYAHGDTPLGEHLLAQALDDGLPWDEVCSAAARGIAQWYGERDRA